MKNCIKIGDKLGYLYPNGKYKFVEVVAMSEEKLTMLQIQKSGARKIDNIYEEQTSKVLNWIKESSVDFADGRKLIKHKPCNSNVMTEPAKRYYDFLNANSKTETTPQQQPQLF